MNQEKPSALTWAVFSRVGVNHSKGRQSMIVPAMMAPDIMDRRYRISVLRPRVLFMTRRLAMLQAGPAISSTSAAPGVSPFIISATAIGMLPVAHIYIGMAMQSTSSMLRNVLPLKISKKVSGTNTVINPAITNPMTSHLPMSCIISTKA